MGKVGAATKTSSQTAADKPAAARRPPHGAGSNAAVPGYLQTKLTGGTPAATAQLGETLVQRAPEEEPLEEEPVETPGVQLKTGATPPEGDREQEEGPPILQRAVDDEARLDEGDAASAEEKESPLGLQTKLTVGAPDDEYEKEADAVAERVMRMPATTPVQEQDEEPTAGGVPAVQRQVEDEEEEQEEQEQQEQQEEEGELRTKSLPVPAVRAKGDSSQAAGPSSSVRSTISSPGPGTGLSPAVRASVEPVLGNDLSGVQVHSDAGAASAARQLGAKAFTHGSHIWLGSGQSANDVRLMAHEATHTVQQGADVRSKPSPHVQRQGEGQAPAAPGAAGQEFGLSEDEMESRLRNAPREDGEPAPDDAGPAPGTESQLGEVEGETEGEAKEKIAQGEEGEEGEEGKEGEETKEEAAAPGEEAGGPAGAAGGPPPAAGAAPPPPGPAAEFEGLTDALVAAYLDENVSQERLGQLNPTTEALLAGAQELSERQVVEPEEGSVLGNLTGITSLAQAFTREAPAGYEQEEPWLQTVARIRDIVSALGGVVGIIGLAATVSGLILSLLIPPVGAFLLTAGRFCDIAALILDAIALVLNVFLTGYNLYRLKNATDPEEKRRLLGLVRQDAMQTVMSGIAVATAVAPGAAKALGNTRIGRAASQRLGSVMRGAGSRLSAAGRAVAGSRAGQALARSFVGRGAAAVGRGAGALGRGAAGLGRRAVAAGKAGLVRLRGTGPIRWANRVTGELEDRARNYFRNLAARNTRVGRFYNRRIRGFHERNVRVAEGINDPVERAYQQRVGGQMREHLDDLQRQGITDVNQLNGRIRQRFGDQAGDFRLGRQQGGQVGFVRQDSDVLLQVRQREFTEIQLVRDMNPNASARELAEQINNNPFIKGRWTPEEVDAFLSMHPQVRGGGGGLVAGAVPKTPHHTIPAQMAPQIHRNPRFMQIVNDDRFYGDFLGRAYPGHERLPAPRDVRVPGARAGTTRQAKNMREAMQGMVDRGDVTAPSRDFFTSDQFLRELKEQGSTGAWVNPRNPSERFLFNPHLVIGHNWNWSEEVARQIFDLNSRLGLRGEPIRQMLRPSMRQLLREYRGAHAESGGGALGVAPPSALNARSASLIDQALAVGAREQPRLLPRPAAPPAAAAAATVSVGGSRAFLAALRGRMAQPVVRLAGASGPSAPSPAGPGAAGGGPVPAPSPGPRPVEPPPSPVPYSPSSLAQIRESRISIQAAIEAVEAQVAAAQQSERDNQLAKQAAQVLKGRNEEQQGAIEAERQDITGQQQKLDQSEQSQQHMSQEGNRASAEGKRGQSRGESVQSEGSSVSVEAKPEEPRKKSWLERAWDATAGAVWRRLVRPVIRAARRKVNQVMQKISQFIMDMINQALGLDEIEAELNAGGEDIGQRRASLQETDAGLVENKAQAAEEQQRNESNMQQADGNIAQAQTARTDAEQLLAVLLDHYAGLQAEEEAAKAYVAAFGMQYGDFFAQASQPAETPSAGQAAAPSGAEGAEEERVTEAHVRPVLFFIESVETADAQAGSEIAGLAGESNGSLPPEFVGEAGEATASAIGGFMGTQSERRARLAALRARAMHCVGLPVDEGLSTLEEVGNALMTLAEDLECERKGALQIFQELHMQAMVAAGTASPTG